MRASKTTKHANSPKKIDFKIGDGFAIDARRDLENPEAKVNHFSESNSKGEDESKNIEISDESDNMDRANNTLNMVKRNNLVKHEKKFNREDNKGMSTDRKHK